MPAPTASRGASAGQGEERQTATRAAPRRSLLEHWRRWAPVAVLLVLCLAIGLFNSNFFTIGNLVRLLNSAAIPIVLCMGATFVILMGSIDLSVEGFVALAAVTASLLVANNVTGISIGLLAVPVAIAVGAGLGFLNGYLHIRLKTPSFMTTLGMGFIGLGIATAVLGGITVRISDQTFRYLSLGRPLGVPMAVWVAAACVLVALLLQERTRFGRWVYAIGTDEATARQAGVPVERTRILAFVIAGLFAAIGGVLAAAQFGQGHALIASGRLFTTIAAVIVGGTALSGGVGSVLNSVVGVFIVVVLANGMVLMGIPPYFQDGAQGLLIIAAVAIALDRSKLAVVK